MLQRSRLSLVLSLAAMSTLAVAACDSGTAPAPEPEANSNTPQFAAAGSEEAPEAAADEAVADPVAEEPVVPEVDGPATHTITTRVAMNADGTTQLITEVVPGEGFKINVAEGFPWKVEVAADAPVAAGTTVDRTGASTFEEASAVFEINAGDCGETAEIAGAVVLGVCDETGCIRVREDVAWVMAAR